MDALVLIQTTAANGAEARTIAHALVAGRLAACVQMHPVDSVYRWQGAVETAAEVALAIKTRAALVPAVTARITELHSYAVPEIVVVPIAGGAPAYLRWLAEAVDPPDSG